MKNRLSLLLTVLVVLCSVTADAHHSWAALYDEDKMIKIEGRLISFSFRSPHSIAIVTAPDEKGEMQRWNVAWNAARTLGRQGITRDFFRPGEQLIITGRPGRDPANHVLLMVSLLRPSDGFSWGDNPGEVID